jgi:cell division septal protein FtsQ
MNAARRKRKTGSVTYFSSTFLPFVRGTLGKTVMALVFVVAPIGGVIYTWERWGEDITRGQDYILQPEDFVISDNSPVPDWIHSDIKAEVIRKGSLSGLSILDRQLTVKVAQAFTTHNWVETVTRVSKHHPARVVVEMIYRKPVAMVEVAGGLLPIDVEGVLLPTDGFFRLPPDDYPGTPKEFAAEQARKYLRISVPDATPTTDLAGSVWGDRRVAGAARIASVLQEHWEQLGLYRIATRATSASTESSAEPSYDLFTRNGVRIIWGEAPDANNAAEARAAVDKVSKLLAYDESNGPLKSMERPAEIDLRGRMVFDPRRGTHPYTSLR